MSLFRLILIGLIAFFVYRIVATTSRILSNRSKKPDLDDLNKSSTGGKKGTTGFDHIEDARFEDITPKNDKGSPPSPGS
jgi:hypothetical protein